MPYQNLHRIESSGLLNGSSCSVILAHHQMTMIIAVHDIYFNSYYHISSAKCMQITSSSNLSRKWNMLFVYICDENCSLKKLHSKKRNKNKRTSYSFCCSRYAITWTENGSFKLGQPEIVSSSKYDQI